MQWLVELEIDGDPIAACRIMNVFRRKGVKVSALTLAAQAGGFALLALVDSPEADVEHVYNFLRGMGGVHHASFYRHEPSAESSFVFVDSQADSTLGERFLESFPGSKLIFASHGKYLIEVPAEGRGAGDAARFVRAGALPLARVRTTHGAPSPELTGAFRG